MRVFILSFAVVLSCSLSARADCDYDLKIVNKVVAPDGFSRSAVLPGGTFPGPIIRGFKRDRFRIKVLNLLDDPTMPQSTSVHWHGLFQQGTNWDDGAAFVSQCPIVPQQSFLYDFRVMDQAGTFWYHSHFSVQYCDGLRGALIIYDPHDPHQHLYDIDDESTVITLSDWYHQPSSQYLGKLPPSPDSTLINGKGRYVGGPAVPLSIVNVEAHKRYRLRLIAMSCDPNFTFSIDGHTLLIIEADGENTQPYRVDSLQIFAGQRYSAVLEANQPVGNYWIRAQPNAFHGPQGFAGGINSAILRYAGAPHSDPYSQPSQSTLSLKEVDLRPLSNAAAPGAPGPDGADVSITLRHRFDLLSLRYFVNNVTWTPPNVPVLLQILSGAHSAQDLMPKGSVYSLPRNKVIELIIPGTEPLTGAPHPFHLHGHSFAVVRSAGSALYNYDNPVRRDTVNTGITNDTVTIRFKTDNAGPWFLHCHIDWHLEFGLAVVFAEDVRGTTSERPSKEWKELCPVYNDFTSHPRPHH